MRALLNGQDAAALANEAESRIPAACFHGGAFFGAIGERFDSLDRARQVINADVLDAWFPPAPAVIEALAEHLPWLLRTSPPTHCDGLIEAIAESRRIPRDCVLAGAGSSDLIFLALRQWLTLRSRVLLLDPTYGEYAHVCRQVVGCEPRRFALRREAGYRLDLEALEKEIAWGCYDLVVLVNPNNPTGQHTPREGLERLLRRAAASSPKTLFWIDEAYLEYVGAAESLERYAASAANAVVCKSMSKVYALSGARAAYLVANDRAVEELRRLSPPWAVGLLAQVAAVRALGEPAYYAERYVETRQLRAALAAGLQRLWPRAEVLESVANYVLCHLPEDGPPAAEYVARACEHDLFLRDVGPMGCGMGRHALRVAVKDAATQERMLGILERVG